MNSSGLLRVFRDVVVKQVTGEEFVAISHEPAVAGEVLTIAFANRESGDTESVRVISSRPLVRDGGVVHELRLARLDVAPAMAPAVGQN